MYSSLFDHHLQQQPHPLIWVKESFVMRPNNYHSQFEIIYFGWMGKGGGSGYWFGDRTHSDVWNITRDRDTEHPTQKPVELVERAVGNSCPSGGLVYEPFAGSGTTIIAAERQGRRCYAMEIEPKYVQVCIDRWEAHTGLKAERV
jgi:DNA modification methylase